MSTYPKLIIFSNKAIPRVKSSFKGASVEQLTLSTFKFDIKDTAHHLVMLALLFKEFQLYKATVISGYSEAQLIFFRLQNTKYPTAILRSDDQLAMLSTLNDVGSRMIEKYGYLDEYRDYSQYFYTGLGDLPIPKKTSLFKRDLALSAKLFDVMNDFHASFKSTFYSLFEVEVP